MVFGLTGNFCGHFRHHSVLQPSGLDVGTGDVDLDHVHARLAEPLAHDAVLLRGVAGDIGDDAEVVLFQLRQFLFDKALYAGVLQTHGIQDTHGRLGNAGRRVALSGVQGQPLDRNTAQLRNIVKLPEFPAEAEGAGGDDHRVFHRHARQIDVEIYLTHYQSTSSALNTGPSLQTCL